MRLNVAVNAPPLQFLQANRMKSKGLTIGPVSGIYDMGSSVINSLVNGEFNKADAKKAARLFTAGSYNWYTGILFRKALDSTSLPDTRAEAKRLREGE